jgi:hypothetical protein
MIQAIHDVSAALAVTEAFYMRIVLAQIRSTTVDLLEVSGMTRDEAVAAMPPVEQG